MGWLRKLKRIVKRAGEPRPPADADPASRIASSGYFRPEDIGWISNVYFTEGNGPGTRWDRALRDAHMTLPDWFRAGLDPLSEAYAAQQHRLWQLVAGVDRPYQPEVDEKEQDWGDMDPVRRPSYYSRRDAQAVLSASDHVLATGMFLKHCGLVAGDWALEYGAGFGQTALALARLGVNVDTVDISAIFCGFVQQQAEFFNVPMTPFQARFGANPRPGKKYKVIWFYESFHHCLDFQHVIRQLHEQLDENGRVVLAGEPIVEREYAAVPYPWGVRLHSEVAAVMHRQHWFELGFSEDFLFTLFTAAGFSASRIDCPPSLFGRMYVFERRPDELRLAAQWLPTVLAEHWGSVSAEGRWSTLTSSLPLDTTSPYAAIEIEITNRLLRNRRVDVVYGDVRQTVDLLPGQSRTVRFNAGTRADHIEVRCRRGHLAWANPFPGCAKRFRGVVVERLRYLQQKS